MALNYRRGSAAIQDAAAKRGGGDFRPFIPQLTWKNDGESKYVLVLTDIQGGVAELLLHQFIPVGKGKKANGEEFTRYEEFLSRKDPALGEDYDDLEERLEREPKTRIMGVMVELEPVVEVGTKKLTGFVAKTEKFTRNTDDGEVEVTAPVVGLCTQSAITLWGGIDSLYQSLGDLTQVAVQITRRGKDVNTRYDIIPFLEKPIDVAPVIDYIDGINYIGDDLESLIQDLEGDETDLAKAQTIADYLLDKRINELADAARYEELVGPLTIEDMPKNAWGRKKEAKASTSRPARPQRRPQREVTAASEDAAPAEPASGKTERFAALKSRVEKRG